MSYSCKILLDSISETGKRLTTFEVTFPRIVLAEWNTHRMFSRNSASSRAIPFKKRIEAAVENPFIPEQFPLDGKGMQPNSYITKNDSRYESVMRRWIDARDLALQAASDLYSVLDEEYNPNEEDKIYRDWDWQNDDKPEPAIHKQIVNRLLEPFHWHTVIVTATEFSNFFKLRTHPDAQYEIKRIADLMYDCYHCRRSDNKYENNACSLHDFHPTLKLLKVGEWHCPLVSEEDIELIRQYCNKPIVEKIVAYPKDIEFEQIKKMISVARCARVSYLTHDGKKDIEKDLELCLRLRESGHWSPFEHVATPYFGKVGDVAPSFHLREFGQPNAIDNSPMNLWSGNFLGWKQYRKEFQDENCTDFRKEN